MTRKATKQRQPTTRKRLKIVRAKVLHRRDSCVVHLPKEIIEEARIRDEVKLVVTAGGIELRRPRWYPRAGWRRAIKRALAKHGPDDPNAIDEWAF